MTSGEPESYEMWRRHWTWIFLHYHSMVRPGPSRKLTFAAHVHTRLRNSPGTGILVESVTKVSQGVDVF